MAEFTRIVKGEPINKTARRVIGDGVHYECEVAANVVRSRTPLPVRINPIFSNPSHDLTGRKLGRLTVIGLSPNKQNAKGGCWVVRCLCGWYEHRRTSVLAHMKPEFSMCCACMSTEDSKTRQAERGGYRKLA